MLLKDFQDALAGVHRPARNDRGTCERELAQIFATAGLEQGYAEAQARLLALAMDLFADKAPPPLYCWIDDRSEPRLPDGGLPYEIGLATLLIATSTPTYTFSVWEYAERNARLNALQHHAALPAPFTPQTPLAEVISVPAPSLQLYRELRSIPFLYKPDTDTLFTSETTTDLPAQQRFLANCFIVDPAPGR